MRKWVLGAMTSLSLLAVGCAGRSAQGVKDDEIKLGRVPYEHKEPIFQAEHNVSVAQANKAMAERSLEEAKAFGAIADKELVAAKARVEVARKEMELGQKTQDVATRREAQKQLRIAQQQVSAVETKQDYAKTLQELREEEIELADKQLAAARLSLEAARVTALRKSGITPSESEAGLFKNRDNAQNELVLQESKVSVLRDEVERMKDSWERRRTSSNVASRNVTDLPAIKAPPAPDTIEPEKLDLPQRDYGITPPPGEPERAPDAQ